MKRKKTNPSSFLLKMTVLVCSVLLLYSCKKEEEMDAIHSLLPGNWDGYETIDGGELSSGVGYLTFFYDNGITFYEDGTFAPRYKWDDLNQGEKKGTYTIINNQKIVLQKYHENDISGAQSLEVHIVKLNEKHLWFRHSNLGREREFHLERTE